MTLTYTKEIFDAPDINSAKNVILTTEAYGGTYNQRWDRETKYTMELIEKAFPDMGNEKIVLDFGCGIGRMSKALIEKYGCKVIGVDISEKMRKLAQEYVADERFSVLSYETYMALTKQSYLKVDHAIAVYSLQHCLEVENDIEALGKTVQSRILALNLQHRAVPAVDEENRFLFANDGKDIQEIIGRHFAEIEDFPLSPEDISVAEQHWCKVFQKIRKRKVNAPRMSKKS